MELRVFMTLITFTFSFKSWLWKSQCALSIIPFRDLAFPLDNQQPTRQQKTVAEPNGRSSGLLAGYR